MTDNEDHVSTPGASADFSCSSRKHRRSLRLKNFDRDAESSQHLETYVAQVVQETGVPGMSVSVLQDSQIRSACAGRGLVAGGAAMSIDAKFDIECVTKLLSSVLALQLVSQGQLDLHATVGSYLPELASSEFGSEVLIWQLLSHTSGFQGIATHDLLRPGLSFPELAFMVEASQKIFSAGQVFNYHVTDHVLLGEILSRLLEGDPVRRTEDAILKPLDISQSGKEENRVDGHQWNKRAQRFERIAGMQYGRLLAPALASPPMSTFDMIRLIKSLLQTPIPLDLPESARSLMLELLLRRQVVRLPEAPSRISHSRNEAMLLSFGLAMGTYSDRSFGVSGSSAGQCCSIHIDPICGAAVAVGVNARALRVRNQVSSTLLSGLRNGIKVPVLKSQPRRRFGPEELTGNYIGGVRGQEINIVRTRRGFLVRLRDLTLNRLVTGRFTLDERGEPVLLASSQNLPIRFFRDSLTDAPCLMWGWCGFKNAGNG
jgi:hypothetical protein